MTILVTGATGMVGERLPPRLVEAGSDCRTTTVHRPDVQPGGDCRHHVDARRRGQWDRRKRLLNSMAALQAWHLRQ